MALSLILGASGSGKSTYIYQKIIQESINNKKGHYIVIVPEQYTMATQKLLVQMHPDKCIMNIDVLSFNRLAYRVFEELGIATDAVLDDIGKSLVIRKLVSEKIDELRALKKNITRISYIAQIKSLISELSQYGISPDKLQEMIDYPPMSENFRKKAKDLLVMYEAFLQFTEGKYLTTESVLTRLNEVIEDSNIIAGSTVIFDGFTGFTPVQNQLVAHMMPLLSDIYVCITADSHFSIAETLDDDALFKMSGDFAQKLISLAKSSHIAVSEPVFIDGSKSRLKDNPVMQHLEANIFRDRQESYSLQDAADVISLTTFKSTRDELKFAAITIRDLVNKGYHYKDFAVVTPSLESYRYLVEEIWQAYHIPYFVDAKTEMLFHPFSEAMDALFDIVNRNFRQEDFFRFLRTGITDLTPSDIDLLENYVISTGIRGHKKYFNPFVLRSNTFSTDEALAQVNDIRLRVIEPFIKLYEVCSKKTTVSAFALAIYGFFGYYDFADKINARRVELEEKGQLAKAKEYAAVYDVIMKLLEKMVQVLGDETMDLDEFSQIYKAGLGASTIGLVPPANDSVIVGDIERSRLNDVKVLFCIGASDDNIPGKVENGGILSSLEREQLLESGLFELAPSDRQKSFRQRFYLYMMLTKPSDKLYITSPRVDKDGKAVRISYLMEIIASMFSISLNEVEDFEGDSRLFSEKEACIYLTELLQKMHQKTFAGLSEAERDLLPQLFAWAKYNQKDALDTILSGIFYKPETHDISQDIMHAVNEAFNNNGIVRGSVSRFEEYAKCSYRYFLEYILDLEEREEYTLSSIDKGNFYHEALHAFSDAMKADGISWKDATEEQLEDHISQAIAHTKEKMVKLSESEDDTEQYIISTMEKTLLHTVKVITAQIKKGNFEPYDFEYAFKKELVSDKTNEPVALLRGKVDRIDVTESADRGVRIIDYKSSDHSIDINDCYYGLSLQLPVYMSVALEELKHKYPDTFAHPSAMLYYTLGDDFADTTPGPKDLIKEERFRLSKMDGLLSDDESDLIDNDNTVGNEENQTLTSDIVHYGKTAKNSLDRRVSHVVSREDMELMTAYSIHKATEMAEDILTGHFAPNPVQKEGKVVGCDYCLYGDICKFGSKISFDEAKDLEKINKEEVPEKMRQALAESEDTDGIN